MEEYSEMAVRARVTEGLKGGPFYSNPNLAPAMNFVETYPPSVAEKLQSSPAPAMEVTDCWTERHKPGKV